MAFYIDTSALVKLVMAEPETEALTAWLLMEYRNPVACDLVRTELLRAVRRSAPDRILHARAVLASIAVIDITTSIFEEAGRLGPDTLRSLNAVHIAAALALGDDLEGLVTYDNRMADAAKQNGVLVLAPA